MWRVGGGAVTVMPTRDDDERKSKGGIAIKHILSNRRMLLMAGGQFSQQAVKVSLSGEMEYGYIELFDGQQRKHRNTFPVLPSARYLLLAAYIAQQSTDTGNV